MSAPRGIPVVLAAASGAGKTTLSRRVLAQLDGIELSISYTTRAPRGGEQHGVHYFFVDEQTFMHMVDAHAFVEWARVHGNLYGSATRVVDERLARGVDVLFDIDVQGGEQIKRRFPDALLIWIDPPSWEILERRLRDRGTDDEATISLRLKNARAERDRAARSFDHVVVNDDLDVATATLLELIRQARIGRKQQGR